MTPRDLLARDVLLTLIGTSTPEDTVGASPQLVAKTVFLYADAFLAEAARTTESVTELDVNRTPARPNPGPRYEVQAKTEEPKRYAAPDVWHAPDKDGWRSWPPSQRAAWSGGPEYDGSVRVCMVVGEYRDGAPEDFDWSQVASWRPL